MPRTFKDAGIQSLRDML